MCSHLPPSASANLYFGTDARALWANQNLLSFSEVKTLQKLFFFVSHEHSESAKAWRESAEDRLLMPVQGQKVSGLMLANLPLSLIELISGVMGWGQSPSSFPQHWEHNRLMELIRSELQWWEAHISNRNAAGVKHANCELWSGCEVCVSRGDEWAEVKQS